MEKGRMDRKFSGMAHGVGCICYNGVGTLTKVEGNTGINADKYTSILEDNS